MEKAIPTVPTKINFLLPNLSIKNMKVSVAMTPFTTPYIPLASNLTDYE